MSTYDALSSLSSNIIDDIDAFPSYSVMLGVAPSKGARSPKLWNSLLGYSSRMVCIDIPDLTGLATAIKLLEGDPRCIGGSVTAPYKESIYRLCNEHTSMARFSKACNNFYRSSETNKFRADNTDSHGFVKALTSQVIASEFDAVVILGTGGVAKAVAAGALEIFQEVAPIYMLTRRSPARESICGITPIRYSSFVDQLVDLVGARTLIVNCTSAGDYNDPDSDPLIAIPCLKQILDNLNVSYLFDCIHTPSPTRLSSLFCPNSQDGVYMNLAQAVIAFTNVYKDYNPATVHTHFLSVAL